jgi:hypothetical protein
MRMDKTEVGALILTQPRCSKEVRDFVEAALVDQLLQSGAPCSALDLGEELLVEA